MTRIEFLSKLWAGDPALLQCLEGEVNHKLTHVMVHKHVNTSSVFSKCLTLSDQHKLLLNHQVTCLFNQALEILLEGKVRVKYLED